MLQHTKLFFSVCAIAALSACANSPTPMASTFAVSSQMKVRAAGHWQALAKDTVAKTVEDLRKTGVDKPVFVSIPRDATAFDTAFKSFLTTELVNAGVKVQTREAGALTVSYSAQIVRHKSGKNDFRSGQYTRLVSGLWVLGLVAADSVSGFALTTVALAGAKDFMASGESTANGLELILTTSIDNAEQALTRKTDVYYVESDDTDLFKSVPVVPLAVVKEMKVVQ